MNFHKRLNQLFIISLAGCFVACGSKVPNSKDFSSRIDPDKSTDRSEAEKFLIECNEFNQQDLAGKTSTYYSAITTEYISDYVRLYLSRRPSVLSSSDTHYLRMRLWREDTPGQRIYNPHPAHMFFVSRINGATLQFNNQVDSLSKSVIENIISENSLSSLGVTTANFFDHHLIILTGVSFDYDVLQIALFDTTNTEAPPVSWIETLIPAFYADPNDYNAFHESPALQHLHPYYEQRNNGWTRDQYQSHAQRICEGF